MRITNKPIILGIFSLIFLVFSANLHADYIEPNAVQVEIKTYEPVKNELPMGQYIYDVSWQGIPVGQAGINVNSSGVNYKVVAFAKSGKVIDLIYTLRHTSESEFSLKTFAPLTFLTQQTENSKFKKAEVSFLTNGMIKSFIEKNGKKEDEREFGPEQELRDPISAAFLARSIDVKVGEEATFQIYNAKHRYLITFKVEGVDTIKILDTEREAYRITPSIQKLTDTEGEKRFRKGTVWMATDDTRDILKMESEVLVGSIKATLKAYNPKPQFQDDPSVGVERARLK